MDQSFYRTVWRKMAKFRGQDSANPASGHSFAQKSVADALHLGHMGQFRAANTTMLQLHNAACGRASNLITTP
ncbi:hypothetical protein [uncultured Tateyamaria sp.]|uniref:hypothetical protein n=1 Tax=uncultured Tateyamaria sp. TaxID=455651 RepID=UPI00260A50C2|nr:hypothetical protein [uncultured Tateyamaria sp.]